MMHAWSQRAVLGAICAIVLFPASLSAQTVPKTVTTDQLAKTQTGSNDWITNNGAMNNQRFSTLDQINTTNVSQMKGAWLTRLGSGKARSTALKPTRSYRRDHVYPDGQRRHLCAGRKDGPKDLGVRLDIPQVNDTICCGWNNRGVAAGDGRIFCGHLDGSFVALDQKTGQSPGARSSRTTKTATASPARRATSMAWCSPVCRAVSTASAAACTALDAETGRDVWRFYTVPSSRSKLAPTPGPTTIPIR